jgi:ABC-type transporter Mla subunit MlaD
MNINNVLYFMIVLLLIYLFLYNILRYNKVIEGASLSNDEIDMIYTQNTDINALKQKKQNIEQKIAEVEANMAVTNSVLTGTTDTIQKNLKKSEEKLNETGVKRDK